MKSAVVLTVTLATLVLALAFWAFIPSGALAAVPKLINFQGILKDGSGNPVANASYPVIFTIYDTPAGGSVQWAETTSVTTSSGLFSVLLGSTNPVPDTAFKGSERWLGIAVSPDAEMPQRQQLVSVGYAYRVNSVDSASGGTITSKVSIGPGQINTGTDAFVAGANNRARGAYSTVSGGGGATPFDSNAALGDNSTIGGGMRNTASGLFATVGGGRLNSAGGNNATVGGGTRDTASNESATVSGGQFNTASGVRSTVGGGGNNNANGFAATVGGGQVNTASGGDATVGGGGSNTASGIAATVGGGGSNTASNIFATVGGGEFSTASGFRATVGGGQLNTASGNVATVGGGSTNGATGFAATVGGGTFDTASGTYATVPGGLENVAFGTASFAAGARAKAIHSGCFVWSEGTPFSSTAVNQFLINAPGGVGIGTNGPATTLHVANSTSPAGITLGVSAAACGFTALLTSLSTVSGGYASLQAIKSSGTTFGDLILNGSGGNVGIGTTAPAALLHVNGTAGNGTGVWSNLSDRRLKRDIEPIQNALETVNQLQPVSFCWKDAKKNAEFGRVRGLIAQDVEKVIPEWVKIDPDGYKRLEPIGVDALLIEAIKEQQKQIEELKEKIARLEKTKTQARVE